MKAVMIMGTTAQAGKSLLATTICRILVRRGWRVVPFQAETITSSTYTTQGGGEIGYSQAVQAWAANTSPKLEMNPILLKQQGDDALEIFLEGKSLGMLSLQDYYEGRAQDCWLGVVRSLKKLEEEFDLLVSEGCYSPVEMNIKPWEISNMKLASHLAAPTILLADMERGGVFAQIIGTLELLSPDERALIRGIVLNKVRHHRSLLPSTIQWIEEKTGIPVIGTIPWLEQIQSADDTLDLLERKDRHQNSTNKLTIAVIHLPKISNFTDFDPLEAEPTVAVQYLAPNDALNYPDAVIIPGSKNAIADLRVLHQSGMVKAIQEYAAAGGTVMGICGGFQMIGKLLLDPDSSDDQEGRHRGIGLLPIQTMLGGQAVARHRQVSSRYPDVGLPISGYELHYGRTNLIHDQSRAEQVNFEQLFDAAGLGLVDMTHSIWGTYLHGLFDNSPWRRTWLNRLRQRRGLNSLPTGIANYREQRETLLDSLANQIEKQLDLSKLLL